LLAAKSLSTGNKGPPQLAFGYCTVSVQDLLTRGREGNTFQNGGKVPNFPKENTWAFWGNFLPNTFCGLYYDQLRFLLQWDLLTLQLDPGCNNRSNANCLKHLDT